jgi:hypothetical protein
MCCIGTGDTQMTDLLATSSNQIEVHVTRIDRTLGFVGGWKNNKQRPTSSPLFSVYFRNDQPVLVDGTGAPHPKLVVRAATAAWRNLL